MTAGPFLRWDQASFSICRWRRATNRTRNPSKPYECAAANFGHFPKPQRFVKGNIGGNIIRRKLNLPHVTESFQHSLHQLGADALPLMLRKHQNVLDQHDGMAVANGTDDAQQRLSIVSAEGKKRICNPRS